MNMSLHIEKHEIDGEEKIVLATDSGVIVAIFVCEEAAKIYKEQTTLTWMFANEAGRSGI